MTKEQAISKVEDLIFEMTGKICPLSSGYCKEKCICFQPPYYVYHKQVANEDQVINLEEMDIWFVRQGCCTAYILKGPEKGGD